MVTCSKALPVLICMLFGSLLCSNAWLAFSKTPHRCSVDDDKCGSLQNSQDTNLIESPSAQGQKIDDYPENEHSLDDKTPPDESQFKVENDYESSTELGTYENPNVDEYLHDYINDTRYTSEYYDEYDYAEENDVDNESPESKLVQDFFEWIDQNDETDLVSKSLFKPVILESSKSSDPVPETRSEIGMIASRDISSGEIIVTVPKRLWAGYSIFQNTSDDHDDPPTFGWDSELAVWLLDELEKGEQSFWFPFIQLLPKKVRIPIFYDDFLLDELQDNDLVEEVKSWHIKASHHYSQLKTERENGKEEEEQTLGGVKMNNKSNTSPLHFSLEDLKWAYSIVDSRAFSVDGKLTLIPVVDLFNHDSYYNCNWKYNEDNVTFIALTNILKDDPITVSYSRLGNDHFLASYGFIPEANYNNAMKLFQNVEQMVDYHLSHVARSTYFKHNSESNLVVANNAIKSVHDAWTDMTKNDTRVVDVNGNRVQNYDHFEFSVLTSSQLDPNLIAVFGALWYFTTQGKEIDYHSLSKDSISYARNLHNQECENFSESSNSAISNAINLLHWRSLSLLVTLNTTLEEDFRTWEMISKCENEENPNCNDHVLRNLEDVKNVLQYRIRRKHLLFDIINRFEATCPINYSW